MTSESSIPRDFRVDCNPIRIKVDVNKRVVHPIHAPGANVVREYFRSAKAVSPGVGRGSESVSRFTEQVEYFLLVQASNARSNVTGHWSAVMVRDRSPPISVERAIVKRVNPTSERNK